ncbi:MAG: ABC transporter permease [Aerococcus sp.]|nr:ABC transporter permease [Aerococcus sp.]
MKIALLSLNILENWQTRFLHFVLLPLIDVALLALIYAQYASDFSFQVAIASVLVSTCLITMNTFSGLLVSDRFRGMDRYVLSIGGSSYYWVSKIGATLVVALGLSLINLLILGAFGAPLQWVFQALYYLPPLVISGLVLGFFSFVTAWRMDNPYFTSNLISGVAVVLSGALIPIQQYPPVLKELAHLLPISGWLSAYYGDPTLIIQDSIVLLIWGALAWGIFHYQTKHLTDDQEHGLW